MSTTKTQKTNISKLVAEYIQENPNIQDCLAKDLINYSALARVVTNKYHLDKSNDAAVQMACRRAKLKLKAKTKQEELIKRLLRNAKLNTRSPILVATLKKSIDFKKVVSLRELIKKSRGEMNIIEGEDVFTLVTNEQFKSQIKITFGQSVIEIKDSLVQLTLLFGEEIKTTSGVVSYVYGLLKNNNINILEEMSCWTDLMMVIREADLEKAIGVLQKQ